MEKFLKVICLFFLFITPFLTPAQEQQTAPEINPFKSHWTLQLNGGLTQYYGDLNKEDFYNPDVRFGFGAALGYQLSPVFGLRSQFLSGKLYSEHVAKDLKLKTNFWDAGLHLTANINEIFAEYNPNRFINFYLFGGAGLTSFFSKTSNLTTDVFVKESDSRQNEVFFPLGAGAEFRLGKKIGLNLEYSDHLLLSDETLDLFAATDARDHYSYASAGLTFRFGGPRDSDNDGIRDKDDNCPDRPGKPEFFGCPDADNDGIPDDQDDCPTVAGKLEFKGCPDTDGDGIPDKEDACPNTAGSKELKGCPDKDGDGIADKDDKCQDIPGKKEYAGCPDKDGDGVPDHEDQCPELTGLALLGGCPDRDGDGVADHLDKCPDVKGTASNNGCPEESKALVDDIVYFDTDEWVVIAKYNQMLNKVAEILRDNPGIRVSVEGHTDSRESKAYNMRLSERRANHIIGFFTERGIDPSRLVKGFYGESKPAADNSTAEGMALNRRVEIKSVK